MFNLKENLHRVRRVLPYNIVYPLTPIVIAALIPLFWYSPQKTFFFGDEYPFWLNSNTVNKEPWSWDDYNLGQRSILPLFFLHDEVGNLLASTGLDKGFVATMEYSFLLFVAGIGSFILLDMLIEKRHVHRIFVSLSALFYMFNIHVLFIMFNKGLIISYSFLPLLAFVVLYLLKQLQVSKQFPWTTVLILSLLSMFSLSYAAVNPANILIVSVPIASLAVVQIVRERLLVSNRFWIWLGMSIMLLLMVNSWWMYTAYSYYSRSFFPEVWSVRSDINISSWAWTHQNANIWRLLGLSGHWDFNEENYPFFSQYYEKNLILALQYLPFALFLLGTFLGWKHGISRYMVAYTIILFVVTLMLEKGLNEPFAGFNKALYENISGFTLFREPVSKFGVWLVFSFTLAIPLAFHEFGNKMKRLRNHLKTANTALFHNQILIFIAIKIPSILHVGCLNERIVTRFLPQSQIEDLLMFLIVVSLLLAPAIPIINGQAVKDARYGTLFAGNAFSPQVEIPQYWQELGHYLETNKQIDKDGKVLVLPGDDFYQQGYLWGGYGVDNVPRFHLSNPTVTSTPDNYVNNKNTLMDLGSVYSSFANVVKDPKEKDVFLYYLDKLGIGTIIVRNDLFWNLPTRSILSPESVKSTLAEIHQIQYVDTIGKIDIYKYSMSKGEIQTDIDKNANFKVEKKSIVEYHTTYEYQGKAFTLYLSQTYDPLWKASYGEHNWLDILFSESIKADHRPDDYRNIWIIDNPKANSITVIYLGQSYFNIFVMIAILSLIFIAVRASHIEKRIATQYKKQLGSV